MVLEATVLCIDNSEWSRNGDYTPSRLEAQVDASSLISGAKMDQNAENAVGVLTMAADRTEVRVAPTHDLGQVLQGLHGIKMGGSIEVERALKTAQLALKHRMNKNQRQRIVLFVGSPVATSEQKLEQLGRSLKKNNVSLDIVSFGEIEENSAKLQKLHAAVVNSNNSALVDCPSAASPSLSEVLVRSSVVNGPTEDGELPSAATAGGAPGATGGGAALNEFGVDPNTDPELYMALRLSMEEERARQQRAAADAAAAAAAAEVSNADATNCNSADAVGDAPADAVAGGGVAVSGVAGEGANGPSNQNSNESADAASGSNTEAAHPPEGSDESKPAGQQ